MARLAHRRHVRNATTDAIEATFAPVETKVIRLQITACARERHSAAWEIEASREVGA